MSDVTSASRSAAVVGAGPAGLEAARVLAAGGVETRVFERLGDPGLNDVCGEMVPSFRSAPEVYGDDSLLREVYSGFDSDLVLNKTEYLDVRIGRRAHLIRFESWVIDRAAFLRRMSERASAAGARLITGATASRVELRRPLQLRISRRDGSQLYDEVDWLLAADGLPSTTARAIGMDPLPRNRRDFALAVNVRVEGSMYPEDSVLMEFRPDLSPGGYAWIIPRGGGSANVGLGVRASHLGKTDAVRALLNYVKKSPFLRVARIVGRARGKLLPVAGLRKEPRRDRVLLVGDAAWTCHPVNGGGIIPAMISGRLAADAVLGGGDYASLLKRRLGPVLDSALAYRKLADLFFFSPKMAALVSLVLTRGIIGGALLSRGRLIPKLLAPFT